MQIAPEREQIQNGPAPKSGVISLSDEVRGETLRVLVKAGIIQEVERAGFEQYLTSTSAHAGKILPLMAELRKIEEGERGAAVEKWARAMSPILKKRYPLIPFASRLLASTPLYEKFENLQRWAEEARCPMIFSEDTDVIGFGTINPVAGLVLAKRVEEFFKEKDGVYPFVSIFLMSVESWEFVCERQFGK